EKGDAGMYAFASRLDFGVKAKQAQITSLQNTVTFSHAQEAALSAAESVFFRMSEIAVRATDTMLTDADRRNLNLEFNELRNFSNKIGEEKILGNELFGVAVLDRSKIIEANTAARFDFNTETLGGTDTAFGTNNYNIYGFEAGGSLYFNELHVSSPSNQSSVTVHVKDWSIYGYVQPNTQIVDGYIIYKSADGTFYDATLTEESNQSLLSPVDTPGVINLPQFADASDLNLLTRSNASSAVTTLNSYVEQLAEQKAILGANLSDLEVSMDRLSRQVLAGKVSLERMTAKEMQDDLGRISQSIISWEKNTSLMAQAKHINENLINILL
ncbi:MAG: hypothetical protein ACJZ72_04420, partial [Opitutales bacterium]